MCATVLLIKFTEKQTGAIIQDIQKHVCGVSVNALEHTLLDIIYKITGKYVIVKRSLWKTAHSPALDEAEGLLSYLE
jgi:hypothetical protein